MALLAQQELMEAPPARRLIVAQGHGAWWGCDPGTQRVAVAAVSTDGASAPVYTTRTASFAPLEGGARLSAVYADTRAFCVDLLADGWPAPGLVFVEQPSGKQPNPPLSYATGVIIAAVFDAVQAVTRHRVRVETVSSSSWKKTSCGRGDIWKPKRGDTRPYGVMVWARANGYAGNSIDEVDAMGIAEAARRTVALEQR